MDIELKQYLDKQFESVATKKELIQQTETLKAYSDDQTEKLVAIIATTIAEPMEKNFSELKDYKVVRDDVLMLKTEIQKIKTALQLN